MTLLQPNLSPVPMNDQYALLDDYSIKYGNTKITVPEFFIYDGASIPSFGWLVTYTPFHPDIMAPALIHDWLYVNHQLTRGMADQILYDLMILNGANKTKAKLMYQAVRIGGGAAWDNSDEDIKKIMLLYSLCKLNNSFDEYHFPVHIVFDQRRVG